MSCAKNSQSATHNKEYSNVNSSIAEPAPEPIFFSKAVAEILTEKQVQFETVLTNLLDHFSCNVGHIF